MEKEKHIFFKNCYWKLVAIGSREQFSQLEKWSLLTKIGSPYLSDKCRLVKEDRGLPCRDFLVVEKSFPLAFFFTLAAV